MAERSARGRALRAAIMSLVPAEVAFHDIWVWISRNRDPHVDIVFQRDVDLEDSKTNGVRPQLESAIRQASESLGAAGFDVRYHSHEEVERKFNGDYFKYFR